jgi:hypothetical protein
VRPVLQIAGQEHAQLASGKIRAVAAHERYDSISENADGGVIGRIGKTRREALAVLGLNRRTRPHEA